ncbi:hypothetical protein BU26DRAFT_498691 [Trematosphaeria pertusa]|uniref:Uncharacterized protein n=1 Tax=Trematosphaeria pertusa TaxID=390896 RepID=A0A6A6J3A0_9PLEO|nr:uncharacterized protein BU26DRAFT_498691 [Trematosphaeria pertusa]KAF2255943.1 hypothetical protein BU26DRAFT_498691 [Trematosphaeria pertusa]
MDEKNQIDKQYEDVSSRLEAHHMRDKVVRIPYRLVASCFYFEKTGPAREVDDHFVVQGTICCRFAKGSDNLRSLGCFDVGSIVIPVSQQTGVVSIDLHLTNDKRNPHPFSGFPISGFPRSLADGEPLKRTTTPAYPQSETDRTSMAQKREFLRRKRSVRPRFSNDRPFSTVSAGSSSSSNSTNDPFECPENPNDVSHWVRRRFEARRAPPRPVQQLPETQGVFELYGSTVQDVGLNEDEDDAALAQALERSEREALLGLQRTNTGTDADELQRVMMLSLLEK